MKSDFSEFTYGFLLCSEILNKKRRRQIISSAPRLPSLLEEAKIGYDVEIPRRGLPLFLQFKLAQYLKPNSRARCSSSYNQEFFRITLYKRTKSRQHNLLCELAQKSPHVYYTAPAFYLERDFNRFFINENIINNSVFIPLRRLEEIKDDDEHFITYVKSKLMGFKWHSEEGIYTEYPISGTDWLTHIEEGLSSYQDFGPEYFLSLRELLVDIIGKRQLHYELNEAPFPLLHNNDQPSVLRDIHYLLNAYFGSTLIFLNSDNTE